MTRVFQIRVYVEDGETKLNVEESSRGTPSATFVPPYNAAAQGELLRFLETSPRVDHMQVVGRRMFATLLPTSIREAFYATLDAAKV